MKSILFSPEIISHLSTILALIEADPMPEKFARALATVAVEERKRRGLPPLPERSVSPLPSSLQRFELN